MNVVSIIISLLLFLLLATALYKGIFQRNKINNPYTSEFEDITSGNKPNTDGRNPITQTKEKVQQESTNEELSKQVQINKEISNSKTLDSSASEHQKLIFDEQASTEFQNVDDEFSNTATFDNIQETEVTFDETKLSEEPQLFDELTNYTEENGVEDSKIFEELKDFSADNLQGEIFDETVEVPEVNEEPKLFEEPEDFSADNLQGESFEEVVEVPEVKEKSQLFEEPTKFTEEDVQGEGFDDLLEPESFNDNLKETEEFSKEKIHLKPLDSPNDEPRT